MLCVVLASIISLSVSSLCVCSNTPVCMTLRLISYYVFLFPCEFFSICVGAMPSSDLALAEMNCVSDYFFTLKYSRGGCFTFDLLGECNGRKQNNSYFVKYKSILLRGCFRCPLTFTLDLKKYENLSTLKNIFRYIFL